MSGCELLEGRFIFQSKTCIQWARMISDCMRPSSPRCWKLLRMIDSSVNSLRNWFERRRQVPRAPDPSRHIVSYFALAFGELALGMSGIFVKWANAPGAVNGMYRMGIATALLAIPFSVQIKRRGQPSARHAWFAVLSGMLFALDLMAWNTAMLITSAANATLFGNTSPLWVGIGSLVLFKRRLHPTFWAGTFLTMTGAAVILSRDFLTHPTLGTGDLLGLSAGLFYGLFFLAAERAREKLSSLAALWISAASSTAILYILSLVFSQPLTGYSARTYANLLALALVVQIGGWLAINHALGHLPATLVAPTMLGQVVFTALLAVPLLGQPLGPTQVGGGLIVLAGILIVHRSR